MRYSKKFTTTITAIIILFLIVCIPVRAVGENSSTASGDTPNATETDTGDIIEGDTSDTTKEEPTNTEENDELDGSAAEKDDMSSNSTEAVTSIQAEETEDTAQAETTSPRIGEGDAPATLRVNLMEVPFGVKKSQLRFSWVDSMENSMSSQQAYRIVIADRTSDVTAGIYVYDSNWIESSDNTSVNLQDVAEILEDNELYYWQVQIKNNEGIESSLSNPQAFTTAMEGKLASNKGIWGSNGQKFVFLRHGFSVKSNIEKAVLSVSATSGVETSQYVYNMYVNEEEVGMGPVRGDTSNLYYNTYDITDSLKEGENVLGSINYSEKNSSFLCQLTVYYADGTSEIVVNSGRDASKWRYKNADSVYMGSNNSSIGTSYYTARQENINGRNYPFGWLESGYNTSGWGNAVTNNYINSYNLQPSESTNMKRYEVTPVSVESKGNGVYLIDFGKEFIGSIGFNVNASKTQSVLLQYGEQLDDFGNAKYQMNTGNVYQETWTLKSGSQFLQGLGMKAFRYVTIRNASGISLNTENVTGYAIKQNVDADASSFSSSNDVLNQIYDLCKYTNQTTTQDLYVDTQSRERIVYEGDAYIAGMSAFSFNAASTVNRMTSRYSLDHTTWPAEYSMYNIMLEYKNYLHTGDDRGLASAYNKLKAKSLEKYYDSSMGLMKTISNSSVKDQKIIVDWPDIERDNYSLADSYYNTVFNAVCVGGYQDMASIARTLGKDGEADHYQNLSDTIKKNMIAKMYNQSTGCFYDGLTQAGSIVNHSAQHATAYALAFGIYSDYTMSDQMADTIETDGELKMSVYGVYFLLQGLYDSGNDTLARQIMSNPDSEKGVRSWMAMMNSSGATTTTEAWDEAYKSNMSYCHVWSCAPAVMLAQGMFGIKPTSAGYETFDIKIQPGGVESASIKIPTMKGTISSDYQIQTNGGIVTNITVPSNSKAKIYIPTENEASQLTVDGQSVTDFAVENGYIAYELTSGMHTVSATTTGIEVDSTEIAETDVVYNIYNKNKWQGDASNDITLGQWNGETIEALKLHIKNKDVEGGIQYATYMQTHGWQSMVSEGEESGLKDAEKRMEAFKAELTGALAEKYDLYYQVYVDGNGWSGWGENGEPAGTSGYAKKITALRMRLVVKGSSAPGSCLNAYNSTDKAISYQAHVQSYGWIKEVGDGEQAGTTGLGKRLEALTIQLKNPPVSGGITYSTHVQSYGWQSWKANGTISGTTGQAKRIEAIKIQLTGEIAKTYDVYYRMHVQTFGWLDWAKNGEIAGSTGLAKRMESMQIVLVKKGNAAPGPTLKPCAVPEIAYKTHVQTYGWQDYAVNGATSGTVGQAKRLEGIRIENRLADVQGNVEYRTHVQTYGWESDWKQNGQLSGTTGESKRLEAIQIQLIGPLEKEYDVYYRVHVQSYGWLGWAKNGESAGTEGLAKRLEGIEIVYVKKGGSAPGSTSDTFVKG